MPNEDKMIRVIFEALCKECSASYRTSEPQRYVYCSRCAKIKHTGARGSATPEEVEQALSLWALIKHKAACVEEAFEKADKGTTAEIDDALELKRRIEAIADNRFRWNSTIKKYIVESYIPVGRQGSDMWEVVNTEGDTPLEALRKAQGNK